MLIDYLKERALINRTAGLDCKIVQIDFNNELKIVVNKGELLPSLTERKGTEKWWSLDKKKELGI